LALELEREGTHGVDPGSSDPWMNFFRSFLTMVLAASGDSLLSSWYNPLTAALPFP